MDFREIKRRLRLEAAYLNPITLGISAGVAMLFGALFLAGIPPRFAAFHLPAHHMPTFLHILLLLFSYALLGVGFALLLDAPEGKHCTPRLHPQKTAGLLLYFSILVLSYIWVPLVCKAGSYFLGVLLCAVILIALFALHLLIHKLSLLSSIAACFYAVWMVYTLYTSLKFLFFA